MSKDRTPPPKDKKKGKSKRVSVGSTQAAPATPGVPSAAVAASKAPPTVAKAQPSPAQSQTVQNPAPGDWSVSLEAGLYALIVFGAFAIRLFDLGRFPLQQSEAATAWTAFAMYRGLPDAALGAQSPLPVFGALVAFFIGSASDATARFLPALAGSVAVMLTYALRRDLGRVAALAAAVFVALDPTMVLASRSVDGGIILVAGILALLGLMLAYGRSADERLLYGAGIALGVMFAADKAAGPLVIIFGIWALAGWLRSTHPEGLPWRGLGLAGACFVGTTVLLGTGFGSHLLGIQPALIAPLTSWLSNIASVVPAVTAEFYLRALVAYEPLLVIFALCGVVVVIGAAVFRRRTSGRRGAAGNDDGSHVAGVAPDQHRPSLAPFLIYWCLASLLFFGVFGDKGPGSAAVLVLPIALLAAYFVGVVLESGLMEECGANAWMLATLIILMLWAVWAWQNPGSLFGGRFTSLEKRIQSLTNVLLILVGIGLVSTAVWYAVKLRWRGVLLATGIAVTIVLGIYGVHSTWQLNHVDRGTVTEALLPERTSLDVPQMAQDVVAAARLQGDDTIPITLDDRIAQPVRWYLRRYLDVTTARVGAATKTPIVIVPAEFKDATAKALGTDYVNQKYRLEYPLASGASLANWLRWAHVRDPLGTGKPSDFYVFYKLPK